MIPKDKLPYVCAAVFIVAVGIGDFLWKAAHYRKDGEIKFDGLLQVFKRGMKL